MAAPTTELAQFVAGLQYEDLPARIRERVKDIVLDTIASAIAGRLGDESKQIRGLAAALGASHEATVIGGEQLSLAGATLLNGYLITAVTVCDVHRPTLCHTTPQVVPPALAIGERNGASGRALIVAVAAGLETTVRVGLGTNYPAFRAKGWHSPGVIGPFGGAAAAGKLLGLDADRQRNAFGLAGSQSAGGRPDAVTADLGERWALEQIALRLWPAASSIQTVITGLFALIKAHDLRPARIASVRVGLSKTVYDMHGTLAWNDKFKALLSTPYVTAVVLHDRRCWLDQFESARFRDPAVDAFARERVKVEIDPRVEATGAVIEIRTVDGAVHTDRRAAPKGDPSDPLTRAEIEDKLCTASAGFLPADAVERIIDLVGSLERLGNVRELLAVLRAPTQDG